MKNKSEIPFIFERRVFPKIPRPSGDKPGVVMVIVFN
jgi:hypothetical protein